MLRAFVHAATTATAVALIGSPRHRCFVASPHRAAAVAACAAEPHLNGTLPSPFVAHSTLSARELRYLHGCDVANGGRVIVVGDVHGCCDELQDLLTEVDWQPGRWVRGGYFPLARTHGEQRGGCVACRHTCSMGLFSTCNRCGGGGGVALQLGRIN